MPFKRMAVTQEPRPLPPPAAHDGLNGRHVLPERCAGGTRPFDLSNFPSPTTTIQFTEADAEERFEEAWQAWEKVLADFNIQNECTLCQVLRFRGVMYDETSGRSALMALLQATTVLQSTDSSPTPEAKIDCDRPVPPESAPKAAAAPAWRFDLGSTLPFRARAPKQPRIDALVFAHSVPLLELWEKVAEENRLVNASQEFHANLITLVWSHAAGSVWWSRSRTIHEQSSRKPSLEHILYSHPQSTNNPHHTPDPNPCPQSRRMVV